MQNKILKIVNEIKDYLKDIDNDGVYHPLYEEIYDKLSLIEDEVYSQEESDGFNFEDEDY
jgi:hypothetical protein